MFTNDIISFEQLGPDILLYVDIASFSPAAGLLSQPVSTHRGYLIFFTVILMFILPNEHKKQYFQEWQTRK